MTTLSATSRIPVAPALLAGAGAQLVDDVAYVVVPPFALLAPISAVLAIALTAGAARLVTRRLDGAAVARTGLAVGVASATVGLLVAGWGLLAVVLATLTVLAGVAGAVAGRGLATT
jgi:hypothetical protein